MGLPNSFYGYRFMKEILNVQCYEQPIKKMAEEEQPSAMTRDVTGIRPVVEMSMSA